jgi:membrane protein
MEKFKFKNLWSLIVETYFEFLDDKAFKMSAALSFYAALSIGPLLIIVIAIAGFLFGEEAARGEIFKQINYLVGGDGATMIETILKGAADKTTGIFATIFSFILLVFGSIGVFIELQESLNIIWGVELRPGKGLWGFIKTRLISFSMVVAIGFLLIVSLIINAAISLLNNYVSNITDIFIPYAQAFNIIFSFLIITALFALIFKYLPYVLISWKYVWLGAFITSALFSIGKYLIGLYLGSSSYTSTYGAAASLVILLIWIYYSGLILFFGAELTQVYRKKFGEVPLKADADSVRIPKVSQLVADSVREEKQLN